MRSWVLVNCQVVKIWSLIFSVAMVSCSRPRVCSLVLSVKEADGGGYDD